MGRMSALAKVPNTWAEAGDAAPKHAAAHSATARRMGFIVNLHVKGGVQGSVPAAPDGRKCATGGSSPKLSELEILVYSPRPMPDTLEVLLLLALPASGKSEVRRYLAHLTPQQCRDEFHLGPTVQLDDYPYVHLMRRISQELRSRGADGAFFDSDALPMKQPLDWGTLVELLNEDFDDVVQRRRPAPASAADWLLERFDQ